MIDALHAGRVAWADLGDGIGREQSGRRPVVVISSTDHLLLADQLVSVVPSTTRGRDWPNHVPITGPTELRRPSFAMTEQHVTISRERIVKFGGEVDAACLAAIMQWVDDWLHLPGRREGPGRFAYR